MVAEKKNGWKAAGIVLIIIVTILATATVLLVCAHNKQNSKIDELNSKIEQSKESDNADKSDSSDDTNMSRITIYTDPRNFNAGSGGWFGNDSAEYRELYDEFHRLVGGEFGPGRGFGGNITIFNSPIKNYQVATILFRDWDHEQNSGIDGMAAFYRANNNSNWRYFQTGSLDYDCKEYDTDDLRKAFAGFQCNDYGGRGQIYVQDII